MGKEQPEDQSLTVSTAVGGAPANLAAVRDRGLPRGLGAGDHKVVVVPLDHLVLPEWRDREDDATDDIEMSMELVGLVEVPTVTPDLKVITGTRRVLAARRKGLASIPVMVVTTDEPGQRVMSLVSNLCRHQVDDEYGAVAELVQLVAAEHPAAHGGDRRSAPFQDRSSFHGENLNLTPVERVAKMLGISPAAVYRKMRIGKATSELRQARAKGVLTENEADAIATKNPSTQRREVAKRRREKDRQIAPATGLPVNLHRAWLNLAQFQAAIEAANEGLPDDYREAIKRKLAEVAKSIDSAPRRAKSEPVASETTRRRAAKGAVKFEPVSYNSKLAPGTYPDRRPPYVCATDVSIAATCPDSCPLKGAPGVPGGCYAPAGITKGTMERLDASAYGLTAEEVIAEEVRQIGAAFGGGPIPQDGGRGGHSGRDLRLHVSGDVGSENGARRLAGAAENWRGPGRGGGDVWTYTHDWRDIPRVAWGSDISVLASVEAPEDLRVAHGRGYAAALLVEHFPNGDKAFSVSGTDGFTVIPCPAETRGKTCATCRLCLDDGALHQRKAVVAFKIHGNHSKAASESLVQIRRSARSSST